MTRCHCSRATPDAEPARYNAGMGKKTTPPPPDILRKSGPHKDRSKYDRKRVKQEDRQQRSPDNNKSSND